MNYTIQEIDRMKYVIIEEGTTIHQIPLQAVSSWGLLLGLSDPIEILDRILTYQEPSVDSGQENIWGPLYEALGEGLDKMSAAGVPSELMEFLLDPSLGSPVPGAETLDKISVAQEEANATISSCPTPSITAKNLNGLKETLENEFSEDIQASKDEFIDMLAPVYEIVNSIEHRDSDNSES
jgi:hypothetical protein